MPSPPAVSRLATGMFLAERVLTGKIFILTYPYPMRLHCDDRVANQISAPRVESGPAENTREFQKRVSTDGSPGVVQCYHSE